MADRVIVVGATRGRKRVPVAEIKQMVGRAGRRHSEEACRATIVVSEEHVADVESEMASSESFVVSSTLGDAETLAFHVLPEIVSGDVIDVKSAEKWYSRSLAKFQGLESDFDSAFKLLEAFGSIEREKQLVRPTRAGSIASKLYLHPADLRAWQDNFTIIFDLGIEDNDLAIAWAMGTVPIMRMRGDFGSHWPVVEKCKGNMPLGLQMEPGTVITVTLWWYVLGGPSVGKMRNQAMMLYRDAGRVCRALAWIDMDVAKWDMQEFFEELETRCMKRIPSELMGLCKLPKITKGRARFLHDMGIIDADDIRRSIDDLEGEIDDNFYKALKDIADGTCTENSGRVRSGDGVGDGFGLPLSRPLKVPKRKRPVLSPVPDFQ